MKLKIAVCITFHYNKQREKFLFEVINELILFNICIELTIVSNEMPDYLKEKLLNLRRGDTFNIELCFPKFLGHPYLLTWSHFEVFKTKIKNSEFSHFLYLEDDIKFSLKNFNYWLKAQDELKPIGMIPGFLRIEKLNEDEIYSTDVIKPMSFYDCKLFETAEKNNFINIVYSYQGMYLFDRDLMLEFLGSTKFSPDFDHNIQKKFFRSSPLGFREKASIGLTYISIPFGFRSRIALPFHQQFSGIDPKCFIHHLPNNYLLDKSSPFGKLRVEKLFIKKNFYEFLQNKLKNAIKSLLNHSYSIIYNA